MHIICNMIMDTSTVNVLSSDNMTLCLLSIGMLLYIIILYTYIIWIMYMYTLPPASCSVQMCVVALYK